jgi:hypothetical protein
MADERGNPSEATGGDDARPTREHQIPPVGQEPALAEDEDLAERLTVDPDRDDVKG